MRQPSLVLLAVAAVSSLAHADKKSVPPAGTWQAPDKDGTICVEGDGEQLRLTFLPTSGEATVVAGRYRVDVADQTATVVSWKITDAGKQARTTCKATKNTTDVAVAARLVPALAKGAELSLLLEASCAAGQPALEIFFPMQGEYVALEATRGQCAIEPEIVKRKVDLRRYARLRRTVIEHLGHAHMTRGMNVDTTDALKRAVGKSDIPLLAAMLHDRDNVVRLTAREVLQELAPDTLRGAEPAP